MQKLKFYDSDLKDREFYLSVIKNITKALEENLTAVTLDEDDLFRSKEIIIKTTWDMFYNYHVQTPMQTLCCAFGNQYYENLVETRDIQKAEFNVLERNDFPIPRNETFSFS